MTQLSSLILACLLLSSSSAWAQESGGIKGVVQLEGKGIAEHRIMLLQFGAGPQPNRTPGQTDADGRFTFEGLKTGGELSYVVGIRYEGVLYRSGSIALKAGETRNDIVVKVGATGRKALEGDGPPMPTGVHIGHQIIKVVWREDHLEVSEIVGLRHPGSDAYRGPSNPHGAKPYVLHLPLPEGHYNYNLRDVQGLKSDHIDSDARGLYYTAPLEPGTYRVIYTYSLPMPTSVITILARRTLPVVVLDLFVEAEHLVASSDLQVMGQVPIESRRFLHFRGSNLAPQSRSWFQITGASGSASTAIRILGYGLIIGLTLFGILIPPYTALRGKRQTQSVSAEPASATQVQAWRVERQHLVQQIARLDDEREAGALTAPAYREQRRTVKQQLFEVAQQLQTVQGTAGPSGVLAQKDLG